MTKGAATFTLAELSELAPRDFVRAAYDAVLGRSPTSLEQDQMLAGLMQGDARTWLVGTLRYGEEGRRHGILVPGLRMRYTAQRLFRLPGIGPVLEWINAVVRLPASLRYLRGARQFDLERSEHARRDDRVRIASLDNQYAELSKRYAELSTTARDIASELEREVGRRHADRIDILQSRCESISADIERERQERVQLDSSFRAARSRLDSILPPTLEDVLEVPGAPLAALAKERLGLSPDASISTLSTHARYALFETVFYESRAVAAKQRIYVPYIDRDLASRLPFLDLGCGRGEFLRILRGEGITTVGVDINPTVLAPLRTEGFDVFEQDLISFLEGDRRTYSGVSLLQVAEHLTDDEIERMLALVAARTAPGAVFILETPNPLSAFALSVFHTDPTHVRPLPPERMRFAIEAAGFDGTRTLFQARIPRDQFAGPDPRAYYADYAIIALRSSP